jgi:hypothetical protein
MSVKAIVDHDFESDVGITPQEPRQSGPEDRIGRIVGRGDANGPGRLLAKFAQGGQFGRDLLDARADRAQQAFSRFGRRDAARRAHQQSDTEPRFQPANGVAERRLRHAELGRRFCKTPFVTHRQKGRQIVQITAPHL